MIVLSFVLVIVAAVTLVIGLFQTGFGLGWIWASIGSCVAAMVLLAIGVLQRRVAHPRVSADEAYGPRGLPGLARSPGGTAMRSDQTVMTADELTVVPRRTATETAELAVGVEPAQEPGGERPQVVPKRTAGTRPNRTAAETRPAEMPTASAAGASVDATTPSAASQRPASTLGRPATEQPAAQALERTSVKETAPKATRKATTAKKPTAASAAKREAAQREVTKRTTGRGSGEAGRAAPAKSSTRTARQTTGDAARTELAKIRGLGPTKQEALLREFGSLEAIRAANVEQLTSIRGIGETTAREILAQARR